MIDYSFPIFFLVKNEDLYNSICRLFHEKGLKIEPNKEIDTISLPYEMLLSVSDFDSKTDIHEHHLNSKIPIIQQMQIKNTEELTILLGKGFPDTEFLPNNAETWLCIHIFKPYIDIILGYTVIMVTYPGYLMKSVGGVNYLNKLAIDALAVSLKPSIGWSGDNGEFGNEPPNFNINSALSFHNTFYFGSYYTTTSFFANIFGLYEVVNLGNNVVRISSPKGFGNEHVDENLIYTEWDGKEYIGYAFNSSLNKVIEIVYNTHYNAVLKLLRGIEKPSGKS